jgi:transcriptional regulator with XRE-family HTH domain
MINQVASDGIEFDSKGYASRFARIISLSGLTQTEFAKEIGVSGAFVSDAVNGLKKPGGEILFRINQVFGISIDWLLTGRGTISGYQAIDRELFRDIRLHIGIVKAAIVENQPVAHQVLEFLSEDKLDKAINNIEIAKFLETITPTDSDYELTVELYNDFIQSENPVERRQNLLNAAISKLQIRKPIDTLTRLILSPTTKAHINIIGKQRNIKKSFRSE